MGTSVRSKFGANQMTMMKPLSFENEDESFPLDEYSCMSPSGNETVLIVEDNSLVRELEVVLLKECGYTVLEAANGLEALELARTQLGLQVKLLITDVRMPFIGGEAMAARLTEYLPDLKVLYVTGHSLETLLEDGTLSEPINHIQKPFTLDELRSKVRTVLDDRLPLD